MPYEEPGDTETIWTGDIPTSYKTTLQINWTEAGINRIFTSDQLAGARLSLWFNASNVPTLYLNGTAVQTGSAQPVNSWSSAELTTTHNATGFYRIYYSAIWTDYYYIIANAFAGMSRGQADYHQQQLNANIAAGGAATAENVLGEALCTLWYTFTAEQSKVRDLIDKLQDTKTVYLHSVGVVGHTGTSPYFDIGANDVYVYDFSLGTVNGSLSSKVLFMHMSALEGATIGQMAGATPVVTTAKILDAANAAGEKTYIGTSSNWSGTVSPALSANGYPSSALSTIDSGSITQGYDVLIPADPSTAIGLWSGYGYYGIPSFSSYGVQAIVDYYKGGTSGGNNPPGTTDPNTGNNGQNPNPNQPPGSIGGDPIDFFTGNYSYTRKDISVGSQPFPYGLEFKRFYNSRNQYQSGPLGRGWTHNYNISARVSSDGMLGMGDQYALQGVSAIVELFVALDLMNNSSQPLVNLMTVAMCDSWWIDQIVNNTVVVTMPDSSLVFVLQPDGSYSPPLNNAMKLTLSGGLYTLATPQSIKMTFNSSGQLTGWTFPSGATVSLNYTSGMLTSIAVLGRTLTLTYTGSLITKVSDGTRSIQYGYDGNNDLTTFTDATSHNFTYQYDQPGRMTQYFKPANPTTAYITNVYDSLSRIKTQSDALGNLYTYYFGGSYSEAVDPYSNSRVLYFNRFGSVLRNINALGYETDYVYDGLNRLTRITMPLGNQTQWTYDTNNNPLTVTAVPQSGSGLSNVVQTYTYDPTWAKVKTFKDGNGNTTTYNYDPTFGNLLTIQRPVISGQTPTITYTYNSRGQVTSSIDETGIQTQNNYDTSTEKLTSSVINTNWLATIGGTVTVGNILTLTAHDALLSGGQESVSYTVKTGDTLSSIAAGLAAAVNADSKLAAVGIVAYSFSSSPTISVSTAKGNTTTFTESTSGGATETITLSAGLNLTTNYGYDAAGNINSVQDPNENTTASVYDNERRRTQITSPAPFSYITNFGYDQNSNLLTVSRQTGNMTNPWQTYTWVYNVTDTKKTLTDPATDVTTWHYDNKNRLANVIDAMSREYQFSYDALDRLYQVTDPTNTIAETRLYTNNGLLASNKDARGNVSTFSYDGLDRQNKITYQDSSYQQNESYDANGNVLTYVTRSGNTIVSTYDVLNRLRTKAPTGQPTVTYGYDLGGRLISFSKPVVSGDPSSGEFQRFYDTAGRFYKEEYPDSKLITLGLDSNGNVTKVTYSDGYYVTRSFDQLNRLTDIYLNGSATAAAVFAYDELSRRTTLTYSNGASVTYSYQSPIVDDLTSIAHAFVGSNVTFSYGFNNDHEIDSHGVTDNTYMWYPSAAGTTTYGTATSVNEYPTVGGASYTYDGNGNLKSNSTWTYTYDTENHLTAASETGTSVSYVYDGLHRQIQKTVGSTKSYYIYSGWQRIADYAGQGGALQNRYVYGVGLDEPLIQVTSGGTLTFYHPNSQGSIIGVSNSSGAIVNKNAYGPNGEISSVAGTTFGFCGQRYDADTGLYYYKRRYYSPAIGRFLQPDPIGYNGRGLNLYTYVSDNPLQYVDPLGQDFTRGNYGSGYFGTLAQALQAAINASQAVSQQTGKEAAGAVVWDPTTGQYYYIIYAIGTGDNVPSFALTPGAIGQGYQLQDSFHTHGTDVPGAWGVNVPSWTDLQNAKDIGNELVIAPNGQVYQITIGSDGNPQCSLYNPATGETTPYYGPFTDNNGNPVGIDGQPFIGPINNCNA